MWKVLRTSCLLLPLPHPASEASHLQYEKETPSLSAKGCQHSFEIVTVHGFLYRRHSKK